MTRTFVAIELGDAARAHLAREIARLRQALPGVRWVDPAGLHLTLAFLGELEDERLAAVETAAREAAHAVTPFRLALAGLGAFGPPLAPRVIWVGVAGDLRQLVHAQETLASALARQGFARDTRPFAPHLTLARLKAPLSVEQAQWLTRQIEAQRRPARNRPWIEVDLISVMKSELLRPAARYTRLLAIPLAAAATPGPERAATE